jgi:LysR family transcriptional activator of glutamate synthase operon
MTITQTLYVLETASCRNMSRAAQRLYVSQSAVSQQIARLEEELGYPLFSRTAHGIQLTSEGKLFCDRAEPVARQWRELCDMVQQDRKAEKLRLRLGIGSRVYSNNLFAEIMDYFEDNPMLEITMVTEAGQDVMDALRKGELDLALDRLPLGDEQADNSRFYFAPLVSERQCMLVNTADPRARRKSVTVQDLQGCTMISGLEDSAEDRSMRSFCRKNHINVHRIYRSDGIETNMRLVRDGMGVALGPESFGEYFQVAAVPLEPETWISLQFICLKSSLRRPEIRQLRDYLQKICIGREAARQS